MEAMPLDADTLKEINDTAHRLEDRLQAFTQIYLPRTEYMSAHSSVQEDIAHLGKTVAHERVWAETEHEKIRLELKTAFAEFYKALGAFKDEVNSRQIKSRDFVLGLIFSFLTSGVFSALVTYLFSHR